MVLLGGGPALPTSQINHQHQHDPFRNGGILTTRASAVAAIRAASPSFTPAAIAVAPSAPEPEAFKSVPEMEQIAVVDPSVPSPVDAPTIVVEEVEGSV